MFERLVAKAHEGLANKFWGNGAIPDGITPVDLALDAIEDVLLGAAGWDPEHNTDPYPRLVDIINSKVSNLVWGHRNRKAKFIEEHNEPSSEAPEFEVLYQDAADGSLLELLLDAVKDSPELEAYVLAASQFDKRKDIAEHLGVSVSDVTNLQKRARRLVSRRFTESVPTLPAGVEI